MGSVALFCLVVGLIRSDTRQAVRARASVVQLYLEPNQTSTVTLALGDAALSVWSEAAHAWERVHGTFAAVVGASSRDLRLKQTFAA